MFLIPLTNLPLELSANFAIVSTGISIVLLIVLELSRSMDQTKRDHVSTVVTPLLVAFLMLTVFVIFAQIVKTSK